MKITKKATKLFVKTQLKTNKKWAVKAMVRIYNENQTAEEQCIEDTVVENGIGFTGADANILSSFSKQVQEKNFLSDKQMKIVIKKMPKYWGQVIEMADKSKLEKMVSDDLASKPAEQLNLKI